MLDQNAIANGVSVANSLGWDTNNLQPRTIRDAGTQINVARGLAVGQPAALFGVVEEQNGVDPLWAAAKYGYHSGVDWGLLASTDGIRIFNSHRLTGAQWFAFPRITWSEAPEKRELIECLSPNGIIYEAIESHAAKLDRPTRILEPIDDSLVERLDKWRDQALRYSRSSDAIDEKLQSLFSQLFVLRAVEDRKLDLEVPPLRSILRTSETIDRDRWDALFTAARIRIGSDLFSEDLAPDIPEHVLSGVINDLYHPSHLKDLGFEYDFSWIEADVLGAAYEKYLSTVIQAGPRPSQLDLFSTPEREVSRYSVRRRSGTYYTPPFIHDYMAAKCIDDFMNIRSSKSLPYIVDFACGSGSFLVSAIDRLLTRLKQYDPNTSWARRLIESRNVVGIDLDPKAVSIARLRLWHRLVEEPGALPLPNLSDVVIAADGLRPDTWGELNRKYDIVLGNPPFLKTSLVEDREDLA